MNIEVSTDEVRAMGRQLRHVKAAIEADTRRIGDLRATLGSELVAARLDDVVRNWSKKREEILAHLDGLASGAEGAADAYDQVDSAIAAAARGEEPR